MDYFSSRSRRCSMTSVASTDTDNEFECCPSSSQYKRSDVPSLAFDNESIYSCTSEYTMDNYSRPSSVCENANNNTGFLNMFSTGSSVSSASTSSSTSAAAGRRKSMAPGMPMNRRLSSFFGLGANSNSSTTSSLAFSSASSTSSRSCSSCTTHSKMPGPSMQDIPLNPLQVDEFAGIDFASLLDTPITPLSCTPAGLKQLQDTSVELINRLYQAYLSRTKALNELMNEVDSIREDNAEKDIRIESLKFQVANLAEEQVHLSKAAEKAEIAAEKAREEAKRATAEKNRHAWSTKSIRSVNYEFDEEDEDNMALASPQNFTKRTSSTPRFISHQYKPSNSNSDSGFESGSDSGSFFSPDYSPFGSKRSSYALPKFQHSLGQDLLHPRDNYTPPASPFKAESFEFNAKGRDDSISTVIHSTGKPSNDKCDCASGKFGWDFVRELRDENGQLKTRVSELEECLGACLEVVTDL